MGRKPPTKFDGVVEAELGVIARACGDMDTALDAQATENPFGAALYRTIRQEIGGLNQRRRAAFASQWRQLLCHSAAELPGVPEAERAELVRKRVAAFTVTDQRGKNKAIASTAMWVEVDGERWEADLDGRALRPRSQPSVLLKQYEALYLQLKKHKRNLRSPAVRRPSLAGVAMAWLALLAVLAQVKNSTRQRSLRHENSNAYFRWGKD